jgi:hypothetical protein
MTHMPGYPCGTCGRASNGYAVSLPNEQVEQFCSQECARDYLRMKTQDVTTNEERAIREAGFKAGAYLEQIGKTDLAKLSEKEWLTFCGIVFTETCADLKKQADDEIPF